MVDTGSNHSSEDRYQVRSLEEDRQRTGLFRWGDPENLIPSWSIPPGLMVPSARPPQVNDPNP
ncbi:MAG TPA: hypothetical protein VED20_03510, partial [Streptosporangiaceae bacterium]|nr:hypothetical protein [Streptosporangiaceae bacterium]